MRPSRSQELQQLEVVAGNGLLHRRAFLTGGAAFAAAVTGYTLSDTAAAQQLVDQPWSKGRGIGRAGLRHARRRSKKTSCARCAILEASRARSTDGRRTT